MKIKTPPMPQPMAFTDSLQTTSERGWLNAMAWAWDEMQIPLHSADQLAARDAAWLEMVGPVVEALAQLKRAVNFKAACITSNATVEKVAYADDAVWTAVDNADAALRDITEE